MTGRTVFFSTKGVVDVVETEEAVTEDATEEEKDEAAKVVPARGFEPRLEDPKSPVLPLDDAGSETGAQHGRVCETTQEGFDARGSIFSQPILFAAMSSICSAIIRQSEFVALSCAAMSMCVSPNPTSRRCPAARQIV